SRWSWVGLDDVGANGFGLALERQCHSFSLWAVARGPRVDLVRNDDLTGESGALQACGSVHDITDGREILGLPLAHIADRGHADVNPHADTQHVFSPLVIDCMEELLGGRYHYFGGALPQGREVREVQGHDLVADEFDEGVVPRQYAARKRV